ncbi:hypothetical protein Ancab_024979 [Ancistrocladus abbreviatus]
MSFAVDGKSSLYMVVYDGRYYQESIVLTMKGSILYYERILSILTSLDLSNNKFHGKIPMVIGRLTFLRDLNLSHNILTDEIPAALGNLTLLESLDLSSNKLSGQIPRQLASLLSLEIFNVSENKLVGPIPQGKQLNTFQNYLYLDNPGLCGFPLPSCGGLHSPKLPPSSITELENDLEPEEFSEWKVILIGYGCGLVMGLLGGYNLFLLGKPFWLLKLVYRVEFLLMEHKRKHIRIRGRKRNN